MKKKILTAILDLAICAECAFITGGTAATHLIPAAYAERGYWAIGGEWLLILAVTALGWWLCETTVLPILRRVDDRG